MAAPPAKPPATELWPRFNRLCSPVITNSRILTAHNSCAFRHFVAVSRIFRHFACVSRGGRSTSHDGQIVVADSRDGQPLATSGPYQLIVFEDKGPARWVRNLVTISAGTAH
jgi:hypothetical protein